ncbi:MAG: SdpI family protein [Microthrixaceae bacterium]
MPQLLVGLALLLFGAGELWLCWLGSQRRLPPNGVVGIRVPVTRRSDAAWYAAHEAAAGPLGVGGGVGAFCGLGVLVTGVDSIGLAVAAVGAVALLAGPSLATAVGVRAAGRVTEPVDGPDFGG